MVTYLLVGVIASYIVGYMKGILDTKGGVWNEDSEER